MKKAIAILLLLAVLALTGCQPSAETGLRATDPPSPATTPTLVGVGVDTKGADTRYIRTGGNDATTYPQAVIIRSVEELQRYYEDNKDSFSLDRRTDVAADGTIGFLDACDRYDEAYFAEQILVLVLLEEGSGSNRHEVTSVCLDNTGTLNIAITTHEPEIGTCDMAWWHLFISPAKGVNVANEAKVTITLDGTAYTHEHTAPDESLIPNDLPTGFCGNMIATVSFLDGASHTFSYGDAVELTELLMGLPYDPQAVCRCMTEYSATIEWKIADYGINLTEGFARCETGQATLTDEQIDTLRDIIERARENATADEDGETVSFVATVVELHDTWVMVEPLDTEDERHSCDRITFSTAELADIGATVGSVVIVTYDGLIMESYPAQIHASAWMLA